MKRFFGKAAVAAALVVSAVGQPVAAQETGKLNIVGTIDIFQVPAGPTGNVVIDFVPPPAGGVGTVNAFGPQTGLFSGIAPLTPGTNVDFVFGPMAVPAPTPVPSVILQIGGFTFTATAFGSGNVPGYPFNLTFDAAAGTGGTTFATLSVSGTVTGPGITGFQNFTGGYSSQFPGITPEQLIAQIEAGTVVPSSASASFVTSAIPEPATVALMATGLVAIMGVGLRRRTNA
jgi:hypothetical protein